MHKKNKLFVLPNAWNVGSAYVFEKQGFKAVATSSAGVQIKRRFCSCSICVPRDNRFSP
ncbi:MAG: isocitrate lyase/phosphoenolpyruvate mutase family protein [Spirochaetaceae bacterium]|nr:isocitrate lyase/phosphoenolpyruvate mutase family protein [Spirochaetaceae bacterium]